MSTYFLFQWSRAWSGRLIRNTMVPGEGVRVFSRANSQFTMKSAYRMPPPLLISFSESISFRVIASFYVTTRITLYSVSLLDTSLDFCTITTRTWLFTYHPSSAYVVVTMAPAARSTAPATAPAVTSEAGKAKASTHGQERLAFQFEGLWELRS